MSPRLFFLALPLVTAAAWLIPASRGVGAPMAGVAAPAQPAAKPRGILLRNMGKAAVTIELRTGLASDCEQSRVLVARTILPERTWGIRSSQPLCFRPAGEAGPGMSARPWARTMPERGTREEVEL